MRRTLARALRAHINSIELPLSNRMIRAAWFVSVAISERVFARRLIALRFVITERPEWVQAASYDRGQHYGLAWLGACSP